MAISPGENIKAANKMSFEGGRKISNNKMK